MDKETLTKQEPSKIRQNKKMISQLIILAVIIVIIFLLIIIKPGTSKPKSNTTEMPKLETQFDQAAIDQLKDKDIDYPNVTPNPGELGKGDPFNK